MKEVFVPVVLDEYIMSSCAMEKLFKKYSKNNKNKNALFVADDSFLCDYLLYGISGNNKKYKAYNKTDFISVCEISEYREAVLKNIGIKSTSVSDLDNEKCDVFFFADCTADKNIKEKTLLFLKETSDFCKKTCSRCIVTVLLPKIPPFKGEVTELAERELNFFLEKECEQTEDILFFENIEKLCRAAVRDNGVDIKVLRFDNVFSPDRFHTPSLDIEYSIEKTDESGKIEINDNDIILTTGVSYVREAVYNIFYAMIYAKKGHCYNASAYKTTLSDIKEKLYEINSSYSLTKSLSGGIKKQYNKINTLVFDNIVKEKCEFRDGLLIGLKHAHSYLTGNEYDCSENVDFYCGRIKSIQNLEIEVIKIIDEICKKHNIKFFLAGGTLLGAVRNGKAISWDDDIDIGMLRGDYEKFRKVCEKELPSGFSFSSPFNKCGSHYMIEKIRVDGTYFSTTYSGQNVFPDGIFVDVLVYDETSNIPVVSKIQSLILKALYYCIILKWYGVARKGIYYGASKILLVLLKPFPFSLFHRLFDFTAKLFKNKKNGKRVIDTTGKKLLDGTIQRKGLEDTMYVDFNTIKAPIPIDPKPYLVFDYGEDYINMPNYGKRHCPHDFSRIDLGKYVFDVNTQKKFRNVSIKGELFENEEEV